MESHEDDSEEHKFRPAHLGSVLTGINQDKCPHVPNPPKCKRRASVALVIRIRPTFPHHALWDAAKCSSIGKTFRDCLDNFLSQEWVQGGEPEVLFIKRAARAGDRWTGHIALPGGKREAGDADDASTSIRETREETGLELQAPYSLFVGNLPERVVTTAWDQVPLMVLCPFIYLLTRYDIPPLALQPSEVHSAHWVPLRMILSPSLRRNVYCDVADRFTQQGSPLLRMIIRALLGQMLFRAVKLKPTETLYCSSPSSFAREDEGPVRFNEYITRCFKRPLLRVGMRYNDDEPPLLLWGLTLGIVADLLESIDMQRTKSLWSWPTFSPLDVRFVVWLLTRSYRSRKIKDFSDIIGRSSRNQSSDFQIGGFDDTTFTTSVMRRGKGSEAGVAGIVLLAGYTDRLRRSLFLALTLRFVFGTTFLMIILRHHWSKITSFLKRR